MQAVGTKFKVFISGADAKYGPLPLWVKKRARHFTQ